MDYSNKYFKKNKFELRNAGGQWCEKGADMLNV